MWIKTKSGKYTQLINLNHVEAFFIEEKKNSETGEKYYIVTARTPRGELHIGSIPDIQTLTDTIMSWGNSKTAIVDF